MKLEMINENQLRCTLELSDLLQRHISMDQVTYQSSELHELFRDILTMARRKFRFNTEAAPLMVEAIPMGMNT